MAVYTQDIIQNTIPLTGPLGPNLMIILTRWLGIKLDSFLGDVVTILMITGHNKCRTVDT